MAGSAFLTALNTPDETPGAVDYTQVTTRYDEVVVPYSSAFLTPDAQSTNITLQDRCPTDAADHLTIPMTNGDRVDARRPHAPRTGGPVVQAGVRGLTAAATLTGCRTTAENR